jgi:hypothetical protein
MATVVKADASNHLLRFQRFDAVVRALHDAGVPFVVNGDVARTLDGAGIPFIFDGAWFLDPAFDAPLFLPFQSGRRKNSPDSDPYARRLPRNRVRSCGR